ncbi:putative receptor-like protein kinase [Rosa sericea]
MSMDPLWELAKATNNFSPNSITCLGGFGPIYKAELFNGSTVALKYLHSNAFGGFSEFCAEIKTLGKLRHPNLVKLLGRCMTNSCRFLVYEFIENGSLHEWLHGQRGVRDPMALPWETRMKIVKGVADALKYLHGLQRPVIHRDIKAGHVLLDSNFEAHLTDFGLARMLEPSETHLSTYINAGSFWYRPPEYLFSKASWATLKGDVYSFGVLMLEIASGKPPSSMDIHPSFRLRLPQCAKKLVAQSMHMDLVDSRILRQELNEASVIEYFRIALSCLKKDPKKRPEMSEVVQMLNELPM